jgi:two-component system sensor histidine kinase PilS (NtrC family)
MHTRLRKKLLWLIALRASIVTLLLGSATLVDIAPPGARDQLFAIIGVTYALTAIYCLALKYTERHRWLIDVQLACDAVVVSAIVFLTGGVTSYFSTLYTLPIIAATALESRRGGTMVAVLSSVLYGGIVLGQYTEVAWMHPGFALRLPGWKTGLYTVVLNIFGFVAVAALSGYLAEGLRRADVQLQIAADQLQDLQAFSRHVIDSLTSGLATTDIDGRILSFNRSATAISGLPAFVAVGARASDLLQLPKEVTALFGVRDERPRLPRVEFGFTRPDGRHIELGLSTAVLLTPRGETGFLLTFQDVTDARKHEREARVQQRLAAVGEMAAGLAHEIRNPLASMAGSIQMLRHELALNDEQSQLMDIVLRESERLNETIKSFLAYARPQRRSTVVVDVRQVLTDTARLLKNNAELSERHAIDVDVPAGGVEYRADEGQLRQIVWNLATNGLRAMSDGGRLRLSAERREPDEERGGEVVIAVHDEGSGIAPDDLDGIFQPFRGAFPRGSGLGLSIVQRIVSEYDGEIKVTSEPGEGTSVFVHLPDAQRPAAAEALALVKG